MLNKSLAWLRLMSRAAAERLGVAKGLTLADEERMASYDAAGGIDKILNHPDGIDAGLKAAGL